MKKIESLYKDLEKYKDFDIDGNCEKFLNTVDKIVLTGESSAIRILMSYMKDETDYDWVFDSLIKSIEHFEKEKYINEIIKNIPFFFDQSINWLCIILYRIFNDKSYFESFKKNISLSNSNELKKIFAIMEVESPHHYELIQELRKEIEKNSNNKKDL